MEQIRMTVLILLGWVQLHLVPVLILAGLIGAAWVWMAAGRSRPGAFARSSRLALLVAAVTSAVVAALLPGLTQASWSDVSGAIDLLMIAGLSLGAGALAFVLVLPLAMRLR